MTRVAFLGMLFIAGAAASGQLSIYSVPECDGPGEKLTATGSGEGLVLACGVDQTGGGATGVGDIICVSNSTGVSINGSATNNLLTWNTQDEIDTDSFTHSTSVNPSRLAVDATGTYRVDLTVAATGAAARWNGILRARLNGTTDLKGLGESGYIRNSNGHNDSSLHLSRPVKLTANDYLEALVDRESTITSAINTRPTGTVFCLTRVK